MRRRAFSIPEIPPGVVFTILVVVAATAVLIVFGSGWPQSLMARLQSGSDDAQIEARLVILRKGRVEQPTQPLSHERALSACSEAQDFAVRVAQRDNIDDAALATREMRRVCQPYFDSVARQPPAP